MWLLLVAVLVAVQAHPLMLLVVVAVPVDIFPQFPHLTLEHTL